MDYVFLFLYNITAHLIRLYVLHTQNDILLDNSWPNVCIFQLIDSHQNYLVQFKVMNERVAGYYHAYQIFHPFSDLTTEHH